MLAVAVPHSICGFLLEILKAIQLKSFFLWICSRIICCVHATHAHTQLYRKSSPGWNMNTYKIRSPFQHFNCFNMIHMTERHMPPHQPLHTHRHTHPGKRKVSMFRLSAPDMTWFWLLLWYCSALLTHTHTHTLRHFCLFMTLQTDHSFVEGKWISSGSFGELFSAVLCVGSQSGAFSCTWAWRRLGRKPKNNRTRLIFI